MSFEFLLRQLYSTRITRANSKTYLKKILFIVAASIKNYGHGNRQDHGSFSRVGVPYSNVQVVSIFLLVRTSCTQCFFNLAPSFHATRTISSWCSGQILGLTIQAALFSTRVRNLFTFLPNIKGSFLHFRRAYSIPDRTFGM